MFKSFLFLSILYFIAASFIPMNLAIAVEDTWGGMFNLSATAGKAFGVNLFEQTKSTGTYKLILAPKWVQLTESGILFGAPQKADVGEQEVYFSVIDAGKENSFKILLSVSDQAVIATREYTLMINEVFKADLQEAVGIKGRFEYTGLPKWLRALENGIIVGMPEEGDLGVVIFVVKIATEATVESFQVKLTVKKPEISPLPRPNETIESIPLKVKVGEAFSLNLKDLFHWEGDYSADRPSWLELDREGTLRGTPSFEHIGRYKVVVTAVKNGQSQQGSFYLQIN